MELNDPNPFSQENLYGDNIDDIMFFFSINSSDITGEIATKFQAIIYKHIKEVMASKKSQLPSFEKDLEWLNTTRPLSFEEDLKNKLYVMDFFTYCCINCIHILPYLKKVETEFTDNPGFTVIGIHSPKFPNEKNMEQVKEAVIRNKIKHPVLNDSECNLWMTCGISCWPTVFIVGPCHTLLFVLVGEQQIEKVSFLCHHILNYFESCTVKLDLCPLPIFEMEEPKPNQAGLLFPGNISTNGDCIIVSDTGHNRLLLMSRHLEVEETIGSGNSGCNDGPFSTASFNSPHGTAWFKNSLYVADTGNHSIRKVDFEQKLVYTVFKNEPHLMESPVKSSFLSPWDVCIGPALDSDLSTLNILYIAAAGSHQIWALNLDSDVSSSEYCLPFAGSGKEENRPNLYRFKAGFAQPSGITYSCLLPDHLFIADSESSTIKSIALKGGAVKTIIGGGRDPTDLFQFGDEDGNHINAKLQHPMGVCVFKENMLAITDTYNHKIKLVNVKRKNCVTLCNTNVSLNEPSGICHLDMMLLVADTNNHCIVPISVHEEIPKVYPVTFDHVVETYNVSSKHPTKTIELGCNGQLFCHFKFDPNMRYELNENGCQKWDVCFKGDCKLDVVCHNKNLFGVSQPSLILKSSFSADDSSEKCISSEVTLTAFLSYCDKNLKVCCSKEINFKVIVFFSKLGFKAVCLTFNTNVVD